VRWHADGDDGIVGIELSTRECPRCRQMIRPVPIVYGYPTSETFEAAEAGKVRLGWCMVGDEDPEFACPACDASLPWTSDQLMASRPDWHETA
jgi:hypothetical protein